MDRRNLLKLMGAGTLFYVSGCSFSPARKMGLSVNEDIGPIDRLRDNSNLRGFTGDNPHGAHRVLWDKENFLTTLHAPTEVEKARVVIVGGGIAGLLMAYRLQEFAPVVLEQAPRLGGNSKGETWNGQEYGIGAAYFSRPEEGSDIDRILKEISLWDHVTIKSQNDLIEINGELSHGLNSSQWHRLEKYFKRALDGDEFYPSLPIRNEAERNQTFALDNQDFLSFVARKAGVSELDPLVKTLVEHYSWSTFGARPSEISAAAGLNFYAAEFGDICVASGGNAKVAEKLFEKNKEASFRTGHLVFDVQHQSDGVLVSSVKPDGTVGHIKAQHVVMCCPKFVAKKLIRHLEPERIEAIERLKYRPYFVANVLIDQKNPLNTYDIFLLGDGKVHPEATEATDAIVANFSSPHPTQTILSLYRGIPFDGARSSILADDVYKQTRLEFEHQIRTLLPMLKLDEKNVRDIRISRWGHPMPVAAKGLIANGTIDRIRRSFGERVHFCGQDNWMLPAMETCFIESESLALKLRRLL